MPSSACTLCQALRTGRCARHGEPQSLDERHGFPCEECDLLVLVAYFEAYPGAEHEARDCLHCCECGACSELGQVCRECGLCSTHNLGPSDCDEVRYDRARKKNVTFPVHIYMDPQTLRWRE